MRLFLLTIALVLAVLGCSDGKLNLQLVFWGDHEESSSSVKPKSSSSSSSITVIVVVPSSSSIYVSSSSLPLSSSSIEQELPPSSSSSEEIYSSSSSSSSSTRGIRSSSSKVLYEDYFPPLEVGAKGVKKGVTTRYWDGCRPSCSFIGNIGKPNPWIISRACAKDGTSEIPLIYLNPRSNEWGTYYTAVPCAKEADQAWPRSQTYKDWVSDHPDFPKESHAYTCFDMAPHVVNDTLAYAFAATLETTLACGKCAQLQFNNDWTYDSKPRVTHRALKGKTLIVMANNTGTVGENHFDIMIPGGGLGAFDCFSEQIGLPKGSFPPQLGRVMGGLLSDCIFPAGEDAAKYGTTSDRFTLDTWQKCLSDKCHKAFDGKPKNLLDGCLWHAEWFMAADNPEVEWIEVPCPKYFTDKYNSKATTKLPDCYTSNPKTCQIDGLQN